MPDLDVFWHTGHAVSDHLMHRTFMHALVLVPVLAALAVGTFAWSRRVRAQWRWMYLVACVAMVSHPLLDACTSYGTMMFWPFSQARVAWDNVSVVDPIYTGVLLVGVVLAAWRKRTLFAAVAIALSVGYLALGVWQHHRAQEAQQALAAARGQVIASGRVMPTLGNLRVWRSIYISGGMMHADAVQVPVFGGTTVARGGVMAQSSAAELGAGAGEASRRDFAAFFAFTGGYVGQQGDLFVDERYSLETAGFGPFWGIKLTEGEATWEIIRPRDVWAMPGYIWREARGRNGEFVELGR